MASYTLYTEKHNKHKDPKLNWTQKYVNFVVDVLKIKKPKKGYRYDGY